jgi:PAS domain-containing protein
MSFALPVAGWPPAGSERPDMIDTSSPPARRIGDTFFRHIIAGMRNGVLAVTRDCHVAFINDEACRIFNLPHPPDETGAPLPTLLRAHPDVVRVLSTAFELNHLPNRAEMRLKPSGRVIGYTLGLVRGDDGGVVGAAMFFKDLTRVERLEERALPTRSASPARAVSRSPRNTPTRARRWRHTCAPSTRAASSR